MWWSAVPGLHTVDAAMQMPLSALFMACQSSMLAAWQIAASSLSQRIYPQFAPVIPTICPGGFARCHSQPLHVQGELRIAHCGGFHAAPFNVLVKAVNLVATLLGHPIHWDTETVGCFFSLTKAGMGVLMDDAHSRKKRLTMS